MPKKSPKPSESGRPAEATFTKPIPVRLGTDLLARIGAAGTAMGEGDQIVMRLALKIGLKYLDRINYDIEGAILDKADGVEKAGAPSVGGRIKGTPPAVEKRTAASG